MGVAGEHSQEKNWKWAKYRRCKTGRQNDDATSEQNGFTVLLLYYVVNLTGHMIKHVIKLQTLDEDPVTHCVDVSLCTPSLIRDCNTAATPCIILLTGCWIG